MIPGRPRLVYIAGPYRGRDSWEVERNIFRARELGAEAASRGFMPVIPHANTAHFAGADEFWLEGTLELMRRCDEVWVLPDWTRSSGTRGEVAEALRLGLPVYHAGDPLAPLTAEALGSIVKEFAR